MIPVLLVAIALPLLPSEPPAEREARIALAEVRVHFTDRKRESSEAALEAIAARWPDSRAGLAARLWQGDLLLSEHRDEAAEEAYRAAERGARDPFTRALALRGLGTTALDRHDWSEAEARLLRAALVATPPLSIEIDEKLGIARRERARLFLETLCFATVLLVALGFAFRLRRSDRIALPATTKILAPIYALLLAVAWGRDAGVSHALAYISSGSLALVTLAFAPARPLSRRAALLAAAALTIANVALIYIALRRAGILDVLWETLRAGGDFG